MASRHKHIPKQHRLASADGYKRQDAYWAKAKEEGYAARSIYKLEEIDKEHAILQPGSRVLDLGCAPGSWLQYAAEKLGKNGRVLGVDLEKVTLKLPANVETLVADAWTLTAEGLPGWWPVDVLLSDLAPHTTGIRNTDQARAFDLSARAVLLCDRLLRLNGALVVKTFQGPDTQRLIAAVRVRFDKSWIARPKATRKLSFEVYVVGKGFKGAPPEGKDPLSVL